MRRLLSYALVLSLIAPAAAAAQGTLVLSQNKCSSGKEGTIRQMIDSLWMPIAQEIVNEGKLTGVGSAYHAWGDEWNVIIWYIANDTPGFLTGFGELARRIQQRHPTLISQFQAMCTEHKDSIYSLGKSTTSTAQRR